MNYNLYNYKSSKSFNKLNILEKDFKRDTSKIKQSGYKATKKAYILL